jgi:hypothetical protein
MPDVILFPDDGDPAKIRRIRDASFPLRLTSVAEGEYIAYVAKGASVSVAGIVLPKLVTAPSLSGSGKIGQPMTVDQGIWTDASSFTYQWLRNAVAIPGATQSSYTPIPADDLTDLTCRVTATGKDGSADAFAPARQITYSAPTVIGDPPDEILDQHSGRQDIPTAHYFSGETLTFAVQGPNATIDPVTGVMSLLTDEALSGEIITVSATNSGGTVSVSIQVTIEELPAEVGPGAFLADMWTLTDRGSDGELVLTLMDLPEDGGVPFLRFEYSIDDGAAVVLPGGTDLGERLIPAPNDIAVAVTLRAVTEDGKGLWSDVKTAIATLRLAGPMFLTLPTVTGEARVGQTLVAEIGSISGIPTPDTKTAWLRNGDAIAGAEELVYTLTEEDLGTTIEFLVVAKNEAGEAEGRSVSVGPVIGITNKWRDDFEYNTSSLFQTNDPNFTVSHDPTMGGLIVQSVANTVDNPRFFIDFTVQPGMRYRVRYNIAAANAGGQLRRSWGTPENYTLFAHATSGGEGATTTGTFESGELTIPAGFTILRLTMTHRGSGTNLPNRREYGWMELINLDANIPPIPLDPGAEPPQQVFEPGTFYVDYEGGSNATGDGSSVFPFKTVPSLIPPNSTLIFKGGVRYREPVNVPNNGSEGQNIVLDGNTAGTFGTGRAILDMGDPLTGWKSEGGNLWSVPWPLANATPEGLQLYQGDSLVYVAQLPTPTNPEQPTNTSLDNMYVADNMTTTTITAPAVFNTILAGVKLIGQARLRIWHADNRITVRTVVAYDAGTGTVTLDSAISPYPSAGNWRFSVFNHPACLVQPAQFYKDEATGRLIVRGYDNADLTTEDMSIAVRGNAVAMQNRSHITVQGFEITKVAGGCAINNKRSGSAEPVGNIIRNNYIHDVRCSDEAAIYQQNGRRCVIRDNRVVRNRGGRGIFMTGARNSLVLNNEVALNSGTSISGYATTDCAFIGNRVERTTGVHTNGMSFYLGNRNLRVMFNTVRESTGGPAMTVQNAHNCTFAFNTLLHNFGNPLAHWMDSTNASPDTGNHIYANNVVLVSNESSQAWLYQGGRDTQHRVGTMHINNVSDGFVGSGETGNPFLLRTKNVYLAWNSNNPSRDSIASTGDIEAMSQRGALFTDISDFEAPNLRPTTTGALMLQNGSSWTWQGPNGPVAIDWIGRYDMSGGEIFDWSNPTIDWEAWLTSEG